MSDSPQMVSLPSHLWDALDHMSKDMGVPRDGLLGQAVFTLARLNGYVVPGKATMQSSAGASAAPPVLEVAGRQSIASMPKAPVRAPLKPEPLPPPVAARPKPAPPPPEPEEDEDDELPPEEEENPFDSSAGADDEEPEPDDEGDEGEDEPEPDEEEDEEPRRGKSQAGVTLTLTMANREPYRFSSDSMVIGRGKHCEFVIESNRVSREHARIQREGVNFVLEDLNSSNGTFYGAARERVTRRTLKDGDEVTFGTEKVKFSIKK